MISYWILSLCKVKQYFSSTMTFSIFLLPTALLFASCGTYKECYDVIIQAKYYLCRLGTILSGTRPTPDTYILWRQSKGIQHRCIFLAAALWFLCCVFYPDTGCKYGLCPWFPNVLEAIDTVPWFINAKGCGHNGNWAPVFPPSTSSSLFNPCCN